MENIYFSTVYQLQKKIYKYFIKYEMQTELTFLVCKSLLLQHKFVVLDVQHLVWIPNGI